MHARSQGARQRGLTAAGSPPVLSPTGVSSPWLLPNILTSRGVCPLQVWCSSAHRPTPGDVLYILGFLFTNLFRVNGCAGAQLHKVIGTLGRPLLASIWLGHDNPPALSRNGGEAWEKKIVSGLKSLEIPCGEQGTKPTFTKKTKKSGGFTSVTHSVTCCFRNFPCC